MNRKFHSFSEFYPYYLLNHQNRTCRALHILGTLCVFVLLFVGFYTQNWIYFILIPICGYGFAWTGHFFFEKNEPAAFTHPLYSLRADFVMFFNFIGGKLASNIDKARSLGK
jgi:hypothetical protein